VICEMPWQVTVLSRHTSKGFPLSYSSPVR
jgi:hypothetical protein